MTKDVIIKIFKDLKKYLNFQAEGTSSSGNISLLELHRRKRKLDDDKVNIYRFFVFSFIMFHY